MKRQIKVMCVLLAVTALGGNGVWAAGMGAGDSGQRAMVEGEGGATEMMPPPPDGFIDHMARQLKLTCDQQMKIKALFTALKEQTSPLMQKVAEYRNQLHTTANSATFDEAAIRAIAVKQAQIEIELIVARERVRSQVRALLTPEQRALEGKFPSPDFFRGQGPGHMPPPPPCDGERRHGPGPGFDSERRPQ